MHKAIKNNIKIFYVQLKEPINIFLLNFIEIFKISPRIILFTFISSIVVSILPFLVSLINSKILDEVIMILNNNLINKITLYLFMLIIIHISLDLTGSILNAVSNKLNNELNFFIEKYSTLKFLNKYSNLDLEYYENPITNDLIQKASHSYSWRPLSLMEKGMYLIKDLIGFILSIGIIISFAPIFFVVIIMSNIPSLFTNLKTSEWRKNLWDKNAEIQRKYFDARWYLITHSVLMETRIFGSYKYIINIINEFFLKNAKDEKNLTNKSTLLNTLTTIVSSLGSLSFWVFCIYQIVNGRISIGTFTFYIAAEQALLSNTLSLISGVAGFKENVIYVKELNEFYSLKNKVINGNKIIKDYQNPPLIEFKNVVFSYPFTEIKVLNNFNLVINPGEKIAFVGENGSGKTTIIKLLCRFYDVNEGEILINGINIKEFDKDNWYKHIGVLFQEFAHYEFLSVKESIGIGDDKNINNLDKIILASKKAKSHEFIDKFDLKYNQILSKEYKNGTDLSGGQWQRIALARGFFRNAPILILDEPTSAIDPRAEYEIFQNFFKEGKNKTLIIISHRFSTVRKANKICVMHKGQIIEQGTHNELMKKNGKYAISFNIQAEGYK